MQHTQKEPFDPTVAGGGSSWLSAALQAACCGLKVLLIEKSGILGDTTPLGGVNFPRLFQAIFFAVKRECNHWGLDVAFKEGARKYSSVFLIDCISDANIAAISGFRLRVNSHNS